MGQFDPFDAPEFFCTDLAYVRHAAPGIVRFGLQAEVEPGSPILRVKVLLPIGVIPGAIARTTTFLSASAVRRIGAHSATLM